MHQRPKQTHNQKRKAAYAQLGREGGNHDARNNEIVAMTGAGEIVLKAEVEAFKKLLKVKDPDGFAKKSEKILEPAREARAKVKTPAGLGTGETKAAKRSRLKQSRATGKMPKRKWDATGRRIRTRTKMPGSRAAYFAGLGK